MKILKHYCVIACLILAACGVPEIKHSGFNDLVIGAQQIVLYEDHRFYLELSLGGTEGEYRISHDTVYLKYDKKPANTWPDTFLITKDYFESIGTDTLSPYKIRRER